MTIRVEVGAEYCRCPDDGMGHVEGCIAVEKGLRARIEELEKEACDRNIKLDDLRGRYPEQRAQDLEHAFHWREKAEKLEKELKTMTAMWEGLREKIVELRGMITRARGALIE